MWLANNLYGWPISQKLPVRDFKSIENVSKTDEDFIKNYDEDSDKRYILKVDVEYLKNVHDLHSDLPFLPERMKIDKCNKLVYNLHYKENNVVHIRALKQALKHGLILKKVHRVIQFNQEAWLKPYIDMNTENLLAIEMRKTKVKMNKPAYLGMSILDISKTLMYEFWYDYMKPKYDDNVKLCYTDKN